MGIFKNPVELVSPTTQKSERYGFHVKIWDGYVAVADDQFKGNEGRVLIFTRTGNDYSLFQEINMPPDLLFNAGTPQFGHSLALKDGILIVNAPLAQVSATTNGSGVNYVYKLERRKSFKLIEHFGIDTLQNGDEFGWELFYDQGILVSGQRGTAGSQGSIWVHKLKSDKFEFVQQIQDPDSTGNPGFGWAVVIKDNYIAVSNKDTQVANGRCYIYRYERDSYKLVQTLNPQPYNQIALAGAGFGWAVDMNDNFLVVSAVGQTASGDGSLSTGVVYVYRLKSGEFSLMEMLVSSTDQGTTPGGQFGFNVKINDGFIAVGNDNKNKPGRATIGTVEIFRYDKNHFKHVQDTEGFDADANYGWNVDIYDGHLVAGQPDVGGAATNARAFIYSYGV